MPVNTSLRPGQIVTCSLHPALGPAKLLELGAETATIGYFESIAAQSEQIVPTATLTHQQVWPQNRCYVRDDQQGWRVGRIVELPDENTGCYYVQFPNGEFADVAEQDLYVRWNCPVSDPMEVLKLHGHETPFWAERRWPLVQTLTAQRAAARGLSGLLSSAVDLRDHQVDVARRVLNDPVQRYLLADEVGLGKTIEAGIILRQFLLDTGAAQVVVLSPPGLTGQWTNELQAKFALSDFPDARLSVLSHDDAWPESCDFLVVDEAHHLATLAFGSPEQRRAFARLAQLAHATPRLLLLSATPAASDQKGFLSMLHLLDPAVYRLDDQAAFEQRVQERERIGSMFYLLTDDQPGFVLSDTIDDIRTQFPHDARLNALCDQLAGLLEDDTDELIQQRRPTLRAIRTHVSETYRLHRRMLRHRRATAGEHLVRGRAYHGELALPASGMSAAWDALAEWRAALLSALERGSVARQPALELFRAVFEAALAHPTVLRAAITGRLHDAGQLQEFRPADREALRAAPFEGERALLEEVLHLVPEVDAQPVANALVQAVRHAEGKVVAFATHPAYARSVHDALLGLLGAGSVASGSLPGDLTRFERDDHCRVLIADHAAEEGLNLQFADVLVHLDVPMQPNRLEQRLGRLDRYGRGDRIRSIVAVAQDSPPLVQALLDVLRLELQVYDASVAALQFLLDTLQPQLLQAALEGEGAVQALRERLPRLLEQERKRLRSQDILDAIDLGGGDDVQEMLHELHECEALPFDQITRTWTHRILQFGVQTEGRSVEFGFSRRPPTLVPWERLKASFSQVLGRPSTFSRRAAQLQVLHLLRLGEPFIDAIARYLREDDRGQSYALWRAHPAMRGREDLVAFRFNYVIDGDVSPAVEGMNRHGFDREVLQRRLDAMLAPQTRTQWLDELGRPVSAEFVPMLELPYKSGMRMVPPDFCDYNLSAKRLWALERVIPSVEWRELCERTRAHAESRLWAEESLRLRLARSTEAAQAAVEVQLEQLETRLAMGAADVNAEDVALERQLAGLLLQGVRQPRVRLDSVGLVVLTGDDPFAREMDA